MNLLQIKLPYGWINEIPKKDREELGKLIGRSRLGTKLHNFCCKPGTWEVLAEQALKNRKPGMIMRHPNRLEYAIMPMKEINGRKSKGMR